MQNSEQYSEEFLNSIKTIDGIPCYVKLNDSKFIVIGIHEHLGLVQNFSEIVSNFVQIDASIIIPDLFCNIQVQRIHDYDQFSCLNQLRLQDVHKIISKCIQFAKNKNKIIIFLGFSIGSALGLRLLQTYHQVSLGLFFYGFPLAKKAEPEKIRCPVVIFHAEKDKIKYLSDSQQLKTMIALYKNMPHIRIQRLDQTHGFMNHEHPNFDQKSFKYCRKLFHEYVQRLKNNEAGPFQDSKKKNVEVKEEQSGCNTY